MDQVKPDKILDTPELGYSDTPDSANVDFFNQGKPMPDYRDPKSSVIHQSQILPGTIKQRHIEAWIIFSGTAANRPSGSTEVKAYFSTDTHVLSLWDGSQWRTTTLS